MFLYYVNLIKSWFFFIDYCNIYLSFMYKVCKCFKCLGDIKYFCILCIWNFCLKCNKIYECDVLKKDYEIVKYCDKFCYI